MSAGHWPGAAFHQIGGAGCGCRPPWPRPRSGTSQTRRAATSWCDLASCSWSSASLAVHSGPARAGLCRDLPGGLPDRQRACNFARASSCQTTLASRVWRARWQGLTRAATRRADVGTLLRVRYSVRSSETPLAPEHLRAGAIILALLSVGLFAVAAWEWSARRSEGDSVDADEMAGGEALFFSSSRSVWSAACWRSQGSRAGSGIGPCGWA